MMTSYPREKARHHRHNSSSGLRKRDTKRPCRRGLYAYAAGCPCRKGRIKCSQTVFLSYIDIWSEGGGKPLILSELYLVSQFFMLFQVSSNFRLFWRVMCGFYIISAANIRLFVEKTMQNNPLFLHHFSAFSNKNTGRFYHKCVHAVINKESFTTG